MSLSHVGLRVEFMRTSFVLIENLLILRLNGLRFIPKEIALLDFPICEHQIIDSLMGRQTHAATAT